MRAWDRWVALFSEEDAADEPRYDPAQLGTVVVACVAACGALFWLMWTALVYEGGLMRGEGRAANAAALALLALLAAALRLAERRAAARR